MLTFAAYGDYFTDDWYAELGLSYGHAWNDSQRMNSGSVYEADYDSDLIGSWLEGGYVFPMSDSFNLEPYGRATYIHGEHGGYTETGTGISKATVEDHSTDNLISELGLRGVNDWTLEGESVIRLSLFAGWRQEWLDNVISVNTSIMGLGQEARSPEADSSALVLGVDGDWYINDAWSIGIQYKPTFSGNWQNHAINGSASFRF